MVGAFVELETTGHRSGLHGPVGYVVAENGCWEWVGSRAVGGYGQLRRDGRYFKAHRFYYERERGAIPQGLQLDHLCRNRACVNPAHLEAVTQRVNILRGVSPSAQRARLGHCPLGHPLSGDNLAIKCSPRRRRVCVECRRRQGRKDNQRRRARLREIALNATK